MKILLAYPFSVLSQLKKAISCIHGPYVLHRHDSLWTKAYNEDMIAKSANKTGRGLYYRFLPPSIPRSAIRRFARQIARRFDPAKIVLFGSFAYGTPHEWSDVDLLVIMP